VDERRRDIGDGLMPECSPAVNLGKEGKAEESWRSEAEMHVDVLARLVRCRTSNFKCAMGSCREGIYNDLVHGRNDGKSCYICICLHFGLFFGAG
jgi:hypothetical protein